MPLPDGLPDAEFTLTLAEPVKVKGGGELTELKLREPTAIEVWKAEAHLRGGSHPEAEMLYKRKLISEVSGIVEANLGAVLLNDMIEASRYLLTFVEAGLEETTSTEPTWEIELPEPVQHKGMTYASVTLRAPTFDAVCKAQGQVRKGMDAQSMRSFQMWLVTNVSEAPFDVVKQIPVSLLNAGCRYIGGFPLPGPRTGAT